MIHEVAPVIPQDMTQAEHQLSGGGPTQPGAGENLNDGPDPGELLKNNRLLELLRESVQQPLLLLSLDEDYDKDFRTISKRLNDLTTLDKQRQLNYHTEKLNEQYFKLHNKTLIENTFANLQRIFDDPRVQNQIRFQATQVSNRQMRTDDQWSAFKRHFSLRPDIESRIALCKLIGKTPMLSEATLA